MKLSKIFPRISLNTTTERSPESFQPAELALHRQSSARKPSGERGITLIDTIVGIALMLVVFLGIYAAFKLSVDVVSNNKARAGAIALADERMEYIRSLTYAAVGTVGGVPSGTIPQSEAVSLNGVNYTRRTFIEYEDDPKDGLAGADANGIVEDYKSAKVDVAWTSGTGTRHVTIVTRVSPAAGLETAVPGGTLTVVAINSLGTPLLGASVSIVNASASPAVNINTFTDASGTVTILGAPVATGYSIVVTEPGYSTAQTYSVTAQNTNPNPGNLTVTLNHTTSATFAIDVLSTKIIQTWTQILSGIWTDPFVDASKIATSTNIAVSGTAAKLSGSAPYPSYGEVQSSTIAPTYLASWQTLAWVDSQPSNTSIRYHVYDGTGTNLIPDAQLPGNAAGFTTGTTSLANVSTSTYPAIRLDAVFSSTATTTTPLLDSWTVGYTYGPQPIPNVAFALRGAKTIGTGPSGTIYKYSSSLSSGALGSLTIPNLEWDTYLTTVSGTSTGYDIASACNPQPESLAPATTTTTNLFLTAHTVNSLLVDVTSATTGALIPGATVHLYRPSIFSATSTSDTCGQSFFGNLTSNNSYSISVSATGHTTYTSSTVIVGGTSRLSVSLN